MPRSEDKYDHTIHKYERVRLGTKGFKVYKCALPNCSHYIREELVAGKLTICWRCGAATIMTKPMARMKKPHCYDCTRPYIRSEVTKVGSYLEDEIRRIESDEI